MASVPQPSLFSWEQVEVLDDLQRLKLVLAALPDELLMQKLETERGRGRDDYPVRAVWNSLLAGVVYQHGSIESLRRELQRNPALRQACGFDPFQGLDAVPNSWNYTRFLKLLLKHQAAVDAMFDHLVRLLSEQLPAFGQRLAVDGKAIPTHARPRKQQPDAGPPAPDGRRDLDATRGVKKTNGVDKHDKPYEKLVTWFGYKLHLVVDSHYELPVAYRLTEAAASEVVQFRDYLLPTLARQHEPLVQRCQVLTGDRGYDDTATITSLHEEHDILPVIDKRCSWQDGKRTRSVPGHPTVHYDQQGQVTCWSIGDGRYHTMAYGGYEHDRQTQKFRCPARHYGQACASLARCPIGAGSGQVRVALSIDRRIFTPVARPTPRWETLYKQRTAVERVNGRLDQSFGFERHFIRGQKKMQLRASLALVVMLAMAAGRIARQQPEHVRSLVRSAA